MRRYRCFLTRSLEIATSGVHEFVQLKARDAEQAALICCARISARCSAAARSIRSRVSAISASSRSLRV